MIDKLQFAILHLQQSARLKFHIYISYTKTLQIERN